MCVSRLVSASNATAGVLAGLADGAFCYTPSESEPAATRPGQPVASIPTDACIPLQRCPSYGWRSANPAHFSPRRTVEPQVVVMDEGNPREGWIPGLQASQKGNGAMPRPIRGTTRATSRESGFSPGCKTDVHGFTPTLPLPHHTTRREAMDGKAVCRLGRVGGGWATMTPRVLDDDAGGRSCVVENSQLSPPILSTSSSLSSQLPHHLSRRASLFLPNPAPLFQYSPHEQPWSTHGQSPPPTRRPSRID